MKQDQVSKLLGRPLTEQESSNFDLYLKIATEQVEDLLCYTLCCDDESKIYDSREGYQTVFTAPFQNIDKVLLDGTEVEASDYKVKQNDSYSGSWFNSIMFNRKLNGELVEVTADWGFGSKLPFDLQQLLAGMFGQHSKAQVARRDIATKRTEDFTIGYRDVSEMKTFIADNDSVISKYSLCNQGQISHGADSYGHGFRRIR